MTGNPVGAYYRRGGLAEDLEELLEEEEERDLVVVCKGMVLMFSRWKMLSSSSLARLCGLTVVV